MLWPAYPAAILLALAFCSPESVGGGESSSAATWHPTGWQSEWQSCSQGDVCTIVESYCAGPYAVNSRNASTAQKVLDDYSAIANCERLGVQPKYSGAICVRGRCELVPADD